MKKTLIRTGILNYDSDELKIMRIEIIMPNHEPAGYIKFQQNLGENDWYGLSFQTDTPKLKHLRLIAKIAKLIKKNFDPETVQPSQVIKLIKGTEVIYKDGTFFKKIPRI